MLRLIKKNHATKQPIALNLVDIDKIVMSDKGIVISNIVISDVVIKVLNILLAIKMMMLLDLYALFYLK